MSLIAAGLSDEARFAFLCRIAIASLVGVLRAQKAVATLVGVIGACRPDAVRVRAI